MWRKNTAWGIKKWDRQGWQICIEEIIELELNILSRVHLQVKLSWARGAPEVQKPQVSPSSQILSPWPEDIVNPMLEPTISPSQGLRIWPQAMTEMDERISNRENQGSSPPSWMTIYSIFGISFNSKIWAENYFQEDGYIFLTDFCWLTHDIPRLLVKTPEGCSQ